MELGNYVGTYLGREICGFKKGHKYKFELNSNGRTYELCVSEDFTDSKFIDIYMRYASETSIRQNWNVEEQ